MSALCVCMLDAWASLGYFGETEGRGRKPLGFMLRSETMANNATNRRLLQSQNDLPAQLPSLPAQDEVRDSDLPPQR
jgi:hypothetical protein